jgi:hypothetical protein
VKTVKADSISTRSGHCVLSAKLPPRGARKITFWQALRIITVGPRKLLVAGEGDEIAV